MSWLPRFKLGPLGGEIEFPCQVKAYGVNEGQIELEEKNLLGATFKSYQRLNVPQIALEFARLPDDYMCILRGLCAPLNPLSFIFNKTLEICQLQAISDSASTITLPPFSANGVTITGVFLATDFFQTGTNYFAGGNVGYGDGGYGDGPYGGGGSSFDPNYNGTGLGFIILGTALPADQTAVTINYTFNGLNCFIKVNAKPHRGVYAGLWQGSIALMGS